MNFVKTALCGHQESSHFMKTHTFYEKLSLFIKDFALPPYKKFASPPYKKFQPLISAFIKNLNFWKESRPLYPGRGKNAAGWSNCGEQPGLARSARMSPTVAFISTPLPCQLGFREEHCFGGGGRWQSSFSQGVWN